MKLSDDDHKDPRREALLERHGLDGLAALGMWDHVLSYVGGLAGKGDRSGFIGRRRVAVLIMDDPTPLAALLVEVGLWAEAEGGWTFTDIEERLPKQRDPAVQRANGAKGGAARAARLRLVHSENEAKSPPESSQTVATSPPESSEVASQGGEVASKIEAKSLEKGSQNVARASGTGTGPKGPSPVPSTTRTTPRSAPPRGPEQQSLVEGGEPPPLTVNQRAQALARTYTDEVKLSKFPAVLSIVKKAVTTGDYSDEQIAGALAALAGERRTLTVETLRVALEGVSAVNGAHRPYRNPQDQAVYLER